MSSGEKMASRNGVSGKTRSSGGPSGAGPALPLSGASTVPAGEGPVAPVTAAGVAGLDRYDVAILDELQRDARLSNAELAERIGLSAAPTWRRVKALEQRGVITGY